jgi:hypothetical protein
VLSLVAAAAVLVLSRGDEGDRRSFSAAVLAAIAVSPIVWPYNYALVLVPIAILRPRLSALWFAPFVFWNVVSLPRDTVEVPAGGVAGMPDAVWETLNSPPPTWQVAGFMTVVAVIFYSVALRRPQEAKP